MIDTRSAFLAAAVALASVFTLAAAAEIKSVDSDLSADFACNAGPPSEDKIETFLKEHGFDVANEDRVRRQFGHSVTLMDIDAIDQAGHSVMFIGLRTAPPAGGYAPGVMAPSAYYGFMLHSPPPTQHDAVLEAALTAMVSEILGCTNTQVRHGGNSAEAADFYAKLLDRERSDLKQAQLCDRTESSYDAKACTMR